MAKPASEPSEGVALLPTGEGQMLRVAWYAGDPAALVVQAVMVSLPTCVLGAVDLAVVRTEGALHLFCLLMLGGSLALIYAAVANFWNVTEFTFRPDVVRVRHRPMWWPGDRAIPRGQIVEVVVREHLDGDGPTTYSVRCVDPEGRQRKLAGGYYSQDFAERIAAGFRAGMGLS